MAKTTDGPSLPATTARQLRRFITGHYKPKLRASAYKRFSATALRRVEQNQPALGFLPGRTTARPRPRPSTPTAPPVPDQYAGLPDSAVAALRGILARGQAHQAYAKDVNSFVGGRLDALTNANAQAQANYQSNMAQAAGAYGAAAGATPLAVGASGQGNAITTSPFGYLNTAEGQFAGVQAQTSQQLASIAGHLGDSSLRNLNQGISGHLAGLAQQIPGQYNAQHDEYLSNIRTVMEEAKAKVAEAQAEADSRMQIARMQQDSTRYNSRLDLIGQLLGQRGLDARAQLQSDTTLASAGLTAGARVQSTNAQVAARAAERALDRASRERLAAANRRLQTWRTRVQTRNQRAGRAGGALTANQQRSLQIRVAAEYQKWWTGSPGVKRINPDTGVEEIVPNTATGGRAEASVDKAQAAVSALGYLAGLGADGTQIVTLMLRHFTRDEIEYARQQLGLE